MIKNNTLGILVAKDKTFYYLVTNNVTPQTNVNRLLTTLMARGLVKYVQDDPTYREQSFSVISYGQASSAGYEMSPVYMSEHVQSQSQKLEEEEQVNPWSKD